MTALSFQNVVKSFGGDKVLDGLSFDVAKGEVFCIAGPSGTGKSVTLKLAAGLLEATSGKVLLNGEDVAAMDSRRLAAARSRIGCLFQSGALLAWMDVFDNVALPLRECTDLDECEISKRVNAALDAVGLSGAAEKFPHELSGGMQKRAGLARAIVREAEIVFYDEPTSGLDPVTSMHINSLIKKLSASLGLTSVVVTHDIAGAVAIADRIMLLKNGKAATCLSPREFLESGDADAAEFVSAMKGGLA